MFSFRKTICLVSFVLVLGLATGLASVADEVWREAESADSIIGPMEIFEDDQASGGKYIGISEDAGSSSNSDPTTGIATYTFTAKGGTYKMLGRVSVSSNGSDSFWIRIPGWSSPQITRDDGWVKWNDISIAIPWHWEEVFNNELGNQVVHFTLSAGTHTLEIARRENSMLDSFVITDNLALDQAMLPDQIPFVPGPKASNPTPASGATDVPRDVVLSWEPGIYADKHDVYFGTDFDDVNDADRTNPLGVLVSQNQVPNSYSHPEVLQFGQTYYWRIDEVNAPPDYTVFKGNVWQFTVEPAAYPIAGELITATASSSNSAGEGPENTINGSGLDDDLHSAGNTDMWLSSFFDPNAAWIQYEFDRVYKLDEMWVWNHNTSLEPAVGFGIKDAVIEYSTDGKDYTILDTTHEFARGLGTAGYTANTFVDLGGVAAKYVKVTANSNWGGMLNQYGLSEVRFLYIPLRAREPKPESGATDMSIGTLDEPIDATLSWRAGREAAEHDVYISSDEQAVIDSNVPVNTVTEARDGPLSLDLGETYYWKVNEVNIAETPPMLEGDIWNFRTQEYFVVEDFEDYNDSEPDRIFDTWIDGWGVATNGSTVGYAEPDFMAGEHFVETTIVHGGKQSMPFFYNNSGGVVYSEAERTFDPAQDWTRKGVESLTLYFQGAPISFLESPPGTFTMSAAGADIWSTSDEFRCAYKQLTGDGQIVARVVNIGGPGTHEWRKAGVMIRESLDGGSRNAFMAITPTVAHGVTFQNRPIRNGDSVSSWHDVGFTTPSWVKLVRQGTQFTGYYSTDGINWVQVPPDSDCPNPQTINISLNAYIGLALTSHQSGVSCVAEFSDVTITGATGPWQIADVGVDQPGNDPEQVYVVLQDSANNSAVVKHTDPAATLLDTWQEWNIDLVEFTGVNMQSIKKISIGIGDRNNPQLGTSGKMYFDDIRLYPLREPEADLTGN